MSEEDDQQPSFFWQIVRVWTFRAAVIGAVVGAVVSFTFVVVAALINPPEELSGAGAILQIGAGMAFSGLYVGTSVGALAGFIHGGLAAWLTVNHRVLTKDPAQYHRAMRRLGSTVILIVLGSLYAFGAYTGMAGRADWLPLGLVGLLAGGIAAFQTPAIAAGYLQEAE